MASVQRKLVHKQFNSPIGLYSDNNVKATLDRELKVLSNGTMGIDFDDISKPANLANSAVLRMLEEEENQKRHGRQPGGLKRVAWPPEQEYQSPSGVAQQPQQSPAQNQYQQQTSPSYQPSTNYNQYQPQQAPQQQQQPQYQPQQQQQYQSTPSNEHQYQAQQPYYRQPSPGIITLRKEAPFNQEPAPVFTSSPSAASFGGGTNMRGDQKWPPQEYKLQSEIDNEARRRLAQGPVLRPRRVQKDNDIKAFFDQHAIHNQYRYYNVPPGTQKLNYF